jgi:RNA 2',3'-cyclic 3'-phosphodiesterase
MATLRLFTALELPTPVRQQLAEVIRALSAAVPRGGVRWVRAEGIHLTLKFYGEVGGEKLAGLQAVVSQAAAGVAPLALTLNGLGTFPDLSRPRVIWAGLAGEVDRLKALQQAVEEASRPLGFVPEARGFTPHLTLGRVEPGWQPADRKNLESALARLGPGLSGAFTAGTLALMRSDLRPGGAVYTPQLAVKLIGFTG